MSINLKLYEIIQIEKDKMSTFFWTTKYKIWWLEAQYSNNFRLFWYDRFVKPASKKVSRWNTRVRIWETSERSIRLAQFFRK